MATKYVQAGGSGPTLEKALESLGYAIEARTGYLNGLGYEVVGQTPPAVAATELLVHVVLSLIAQPKAKPED